MIMSHSVPQAVIFDVFGTLVDWRNSVARIATAMFDRRGVQIDGLAFADFWRGQYVPSMARIRAGKRGYVPLDDLHFENLETTLSAFDLQHALTGAEKWQLNCAWEQLDPWPDVVEGLSRLKEKTIIAPCSNGSIALMVKLARHGELPWDCILGADIARNYKPEPSVYHACCSALRLEPKQVVMAAAHNDDLAAAQACGLQTAFIARPDEHGENQKTDLRPSGNWDFVVDALPELAVVACR